MIYSFGSPLLGMVTLFFMIINISVQKQLADYRKSDGFLRLIVKSQSVDFFPPGTVPKKVNSKQINEILKMD